MTEEYGNLPDGFFLSSEEIVNLRNSKKELTTYGKQKMKELIEQEKLLYNISINMNGSSRDGTVW